MTQEPKPCRAEEFPSSAPALPRKRYARWRALTLSLVYVAFTAHILHWKLTGKTLAPLELNEVMYTLELGIITAGAVFMLVLFVGSAVFGRFFCSWACHIMVLQDCCAWLLRKLGIKQKPIRSRALLFVAPLTAIYMFVWPQIGRTIESRAFPKFHFRTDADGWASMMTTNFWRNLPSAPIIILTFVTCGFAIVYLLGSRTFCTYVCPYGAMFGLADRFAPGRIKVNDKCRQCRSCTAACTSGIRVHEEVKTHGMLVNPACMKDLDCVAACPHDALHYGFTRPSLLRSFTTARFGRHSYDYTWAEEALIAVVFLTVLLSFRGLYSRIPFLLSLAFGAIVAVLSVGALRLAKNSDVNLARWTLRLKGALTTHGRIFVTLFTLVIALVLHSGFIRFHEYTGLRQAATLVSAPAGEPGTEELSASAWKHLSTVDRFGLVKNDRVERDLLEIALRRKQPREARSYAARVLARHPSEHMTRLRLAQLLIEQGQNPDAERELRVVIALTGPVPAAGDQHVLAAARRALGMIHATSGRYAAAVAELEAALALDPDIAAAHAELGSSLAELGKSDAAVASLRRSVEIDPELAQAQGNLGMLLMHLGKPVEALPALTKALAIGPEDATMRTVLAQALVQLRRLGEARQHFERAVELTPTSAGAQFALGIFLAAQGESQRAAHHFNAAVDLDPSYRQVLPAAKE